MVLTIRYLPCTGNTLRLNSEFVLSRLGATAMETVNEYRLLSWLGMQEDIHRMVIYQVCSRYCESGSRVNFTIWTNLLQTSLQKKMG